MGKFPEIKKKINSFFLSEDGKIRKESILKLGLIAFVTGYFSSQAEESYANGSHHSEYNNLTGKIDSPSITFPNMIDSPATCSVYDVHCSDTDNGGHCSDHGNANCTGTIRLHTNDMSLSHVGNKIIATHSHEDHLTAQNFAVVPEAQPVKLVEWGYNRDRSPENSSLGTDLHVNIAANDGNCDHDDDSSRKMYPCDDTGESHVNWGG